MEKDLILAIDQGTTSTRAIVFSADGAIQAVAQKEFTQIYPHDGWVEHDAEEIWQTTLSVCNEVIQSCNAPIAAIGITNQRETTIVWDKQTGKPVYNAIVWQDRRTTEFCNQLKALDHEKVVKEKTGLLLDPYFSATKVHWILNNVDGALDKAKKGQLAFGTIDSFLIWRLNEGRMHATDCTNASRTMLFNIHSQTWDDELLNLFDIPESTLPKVLDCVDDFGECKLFGNTIPIFGVAGDQQAAAIGQACFTRGMLKSTYGTGCFALLNTGEQALASSHSLLTTVAYRINKHTSYALEGSIFIAGAAVQWLRDGIHLINSADETEAILSKQETNNGVYMVPAFTGLGAPHWNPNARAAIFGMTRDTDQADFVRAVIESVCYQSHDLLQAMQQDGADLNTVRVDGGMVNNQWLCQFLSSVINLNVERPALSETTALGAAYLAMLKLGIFSCLDDIAKQWKCDKRYTPSMVSDTREDLLKHWKHAVSAVGKFSESKS